MQYIRSRPKQRQVRPIPAAAFDWIEQNFAAIGRENFKGDG
jgi:hypothetical protein